MSGKNQEALFEHFRSLAAGSMAGTSLLGSAGSDTGAGVTGSETLIPVIGNLPPPTSSAPSSNSSTSGFGLAAELFGSGLGVVSLVSGLMGLFGGGSSAPPVLTKYQMPQSLDFTAEETGSGVAEASFNQIGTPRLSGAAVANSASPPSASGSAAGSGNTSAPQVSVTVQAMDAQSFIDRSNDIAQAVRQAMLNLSSINDVVNDL